MENLDSLEGVLNLSKFRKFSTAEFADVVYIPERGCATFKTFGLVGAP
jgi:hypothetical protein